MSESMCSSGLAVVVECAVDEGLDEYAVDTVEPHDFDPSGFDHPVQSRARDPIAPGGCGYGASPKVDVTLGDGQVLPGEYGVDPRERRGVRGADLHDSFVCCHGCLVFLAAVRARPQNSLRKVRDPVPVGEGYCPPCPPSSSFESAFRGECKRV